jgi:hypothetical protein
MQRQPGGVESRDSSTNQASWGVQAPCAYHRNSAPWRRFSEEPGGRDSEAPRARSA